VSGRRGSHGLGHTRRIGCAGLVVVVDGVGCWETLQHVIAVGRSSSGRDHSVASQSQGSGSRCLRTRMAEGIGLRAGLPPLQPGLPPSPVSGSPPLVDRFSTSVMRGRDRSSWWW
jgi:hypothetical protein